MFDVRTKKVITYRVRQLIGKYGFTSSDREDLEQELYLDLLNRLPKYDPQKAQRSTFIARVVEHKVANIIEARKAAKRDYRLCCSLNEQLVDKKGNSIKLQKTISQDDYLMRTGRASRPIEELNDLAADVRKVMGQLPPELRDLCGHLQYATITETSRNTGIPTSTIYDRMKKIRSIFEEGNLRDYL